MKAFDAVRKDFPEGGTPGGMNRCVNWRRGISRCGEGSVFVEGVKVVSFDCKLWEPGAWSAGEERRPAGLLGFGDCDYTVGSYMRNFFSPL